MDQKLGRLTRSRACKGAPHKERKDGKSRSNAARRGYARSKSRNYAAGQRGGVCSISVCGQLPLPGRNWKDCDELKPKPKEK